MRSLCLAGTAALLLGGCASLNLEVAILEEHCLRPGRRAAEVENALPEIQRNLAQGVYERKGERLTNTLRDNLSVLVACAQVDPRSVPERLEIFSGEVQGALGDVRREHERAISVALEARGITHEEVRSRLYEVAFHHLMSGNRQLHELQAEVRHEFRDGLAGCARGEASTAGAAPAEGPHSRAEITRAAGEIHRAITSLSAVIQHLSLSEDRLASTVAHADDQCWEGVFNRAYGRGWLGNSDIAVVMEAPTAFSVKALRNDSSKITEASFLVLRSGLSIIAASQGLSLPGASDGFADQAEAVVAAGDAAVRLDRVQRTTGRAAVALMETVLDQQDALGDDTSRPAALRQVQDTWQAYRSLLSAPSGGSPGQENESQSSEAAPQPETDDAAPDDGQEAEGGDEPEPGEEDGSPELSDDGPPAEQGEGSHDAIH